MTTTRRGFFGMLAGLAASPLFGRFFRDEVSYRYRYTTSIPPGSTVRYRKCKPITFTCGTGELGTLWWSKEKA